LHDSIAAIMNTDAMKATLVKQGQDPLLLGPKELADLIKEETAKWAQVVKAAKIKVE
jgi:tripartite-type tricarboxylate transporter receptor subunit TctC